jgi:tetratricopeptide (TPR) repeat protein
MRRNQLIVISACTALLIAIYFFGNTKKPKEESPMGAPMGGHATQQPASQPEALDIEAYIAEVKSKATPAIQQALNAAEKAQEFPILIDNYKKMDKPLAVAYYVVKEANKNNSLKQLVNAGDYNSALMQSAPDDKSRKFLAVNAINCYKKAVDLDSTKTENRVRLAGAYMEEGSQPMSGVLMLLDIVKKDSTNADAQLMLGRFGLISGQIDKAIARFEKVLYLQPQNSEALFLLAEAYNDQGNKQKAIDLLERCKKTVSDPATKKDIEKAIENIKKPKS